jgi:hypothetical protein
VDSWQVVVVDTRGRLEGYTVFRRCEAPEKIRIVRAEGSNEEHTVFRRCAAPEKIRIVRTEGNNSGELKAETNVCFMTQTHNL